jgi:hypothetical protein
MLDADKKEFAEMIRATLKMYRVEADANDLRLWWAVLSRFDIRQVRNGIESFLCNAASKYPPVPANIVEAIEANAPDGRPGAEEAWAMMPRDEAESAVITEEMAEAYGIVKTLLDEGDKIAARKSFLEAYSRIVSQNKSAGVSVRWFPSLGSDKDGREPALRAAVEKGRLTQHHADGLLPAPKDHAMLTQLPEMLSLQDKTLTDEQREINRQRIAQIRQMLVRS